MNQDYEQDVTQCKAAAEQGHADAQYQLGEMYYESIGVEQDEEVGLEWYSKTAEQGNESHGIWF